MWYLLSWMFRDNFPHGQGKHVYPTYGDYSLNEGLLTYDKGLENIFNIRTYRSGRQFLYIADNPA